MPSPPGLNLNVRADTGLSGASGRLGEYLAENAADSRLMYAADLALEELGANILRHAFPPGHQAGFFLRVQLALDALELVFEDEGVPFDPSAVEPPVRPASLEAARIGGLGISLVRRMVDRMEYVRVDGRNRLRIVIVRKDGAHPGVPASERPPGPGA